MMALIFTASSIPAKQLPQFGTVDYLAKKGGHVCGYLLLGGSLLRGLVPVGRAAARSAVLAVILAGAYAVTDEFHQSFVPGRGPGATDVGIDVAGASLGVMLRRFRDGRRAPAAETTSA
jgi:VanZ family protein